MVLPRGRLERRPQRQGKQFTTKDRHGKQPVVRCQNRQRARVPIPYGLYPMASHPIEYLQSVSVKKLLRIWSWYAAPTEDALRNWPDAAARQSGIEPRSLGVLPEA
jgi:hypothetical protein